MSGAAVLVTGAGGFVGSAVVRRLVRGGASFADGRPVEHVVAMLSPQGAAARLKELPRDDAWSIERCDVGDRPALRALLGRVQPRAIVHAALADGAFRQVPEGEDPLVAGPLSTLVGGLVDVPGARFLHAGSAWVLGSGDRLDESAPLDPITPYARNKARADALIPELAGRAGVPWINLRLFNLFGRYEKETRLLPTLVARLGRGEVAELTHGTQVRDFNDVDVVAGAFADALAAPESACDALYHVGSGRGVSVREFALDVAVYFERPDLVRFGDADTEDQGVPCLVADPTLAHERLGWNPDPDLEHRVRDAVVWWLERLRPEVHR
jgi:nucleoside-diphosphate-sugar epimerase